jgi:hypothetical protein
MYLINKNKRLIRLISEGNLNLLIRHQLNLSYNNFKNKFLLPFGLVLSGSTMLYDICGKNWGNHSTNNIINEQNQIFTTEQKQFIESNMIDKEPDDYDLYINNSSFISLNKTSNDIEIFKIDQHFYSFTDYLKQRYNIYLDYEESCLY